MGKRKPKNLSRKAIAAGLGRRKRRFLLWMMIGVGGLFVALIVASIVAPPEGGTWMPAAVVNQINEGGVGNKLFHTR